MHPDEMPVDPDPEEKPKKEEKVNPNLPEGACCSCGRKYGDAYGFSDLIIPAHIWRAISPTGNEGGLLCACCITAKLEYLGYKNVPAQFTSGPLSHQDARIRSHQLETAMNLIRDRIAGRYGGTPEENHEYVKEVIREVMGERDEWS